MSTEMQTKVQASPAQNFTPAQTGLLQKKSALCNTPGLVEDSGRDKEKLTLQHSSADQAGTTTVPRFGHDFSRMSVHSKGMIQAKLKINEPGDPYEQEADRVADAVMRMPEPGVQREAEPEEEEEEERLEAKPLASQITPLVQRQPELLEEEEKQIQPKSNTGMAPQVTPGVAHDIHSLKGTGQPLPASERTFFEPRFGRDFSNVRVHTNHRSARIAQSINAQAFTFGRDVVFGAGQYSPSTISGRRLLAHELTHVVQQRYSTKGVQRITIKKWFKIRHRYRKGKTRFRSRSSMSMTVQVKSRWVPYFGSLLMPYRGRLPKFFFVNLKKERWLLDKSMGKKLYPIGSHSETWTVPKGKYYLVFDFSSNTNPNWVLEGDLLITLKSPFGRMLIKSLKAAMSYRKKKGSAYFRGNNRLEVSKSGKTGSCRAFGSNTPPPKGRYCIRRRGEPQRYGFLHRRPARKFWYLLEPQFRTSRYRLHLHYGTSTSGCINVPNHTCYFSKIVPILDQPGYTWGTGYDGYPPGNKKVPNKRSKRVKCVAWLYVK